MMRMSVGMIDVASGQTCGAVNHLICGAANRPMCGVANHPKCAEVNGQRSDGQTRAVTAIVVVGPTPAPGMAATTRCRMANAGLTSAAEPTRPMN
jgi:hypothetical protein